MEKVIDLNNIVNIINLFGETENCEVDYSDISAFDKTFAVKKSEKRCEDNLISELIIEIACSDGRMLTIHGYSHFRNRYDEDDYDWHQLHLDYRLSDSSIISFQVGIKLMFDNNRCGNLYEAFGVLQADDFTNQGRLDGEPYQTLTPFYVEYGNDSSKKSIKLRKNDLATKSIVYGIPCTVEEITNIRDSYNSMKFTSEELVGLAHLISTKLRDNDNIMAERKAEQILRDLTPLELAVLKKKLGSCIPKFQQ